MTLVCNTVHGLSETKLLPPTVFGLQDVRPFHVYIPEKVFFTFY